MFDKKFEWLAQDIWNPNYQGDQKWDYALYLFNVLENRYEEPIDNLIDDMNHIYPDIAKEVNLPDDKFEYSQTRTWRIEKVIEYPEDYSITLSTRSGFSFSKKYRIIPKKWDTVKLYLKQISYIVWLDINWKRIYSKTKKTVEKERLLWLQNYTREELEKYEDILARVKSFYDNLPDIFKDIFDKLYDWWIKKLDNLPVYERVNTLNSMLYNIFIYSEAVKIIKSVSNKYEIEELKNASDEEIKKKIPSFADKHSWNTFSASFALAKVYYDEIK